MIDGTRVYLDAIGRIPRLSHDVLCERIRELRALDPASERAMAIRTELLEANLRLVVSIARRFPTSGSLELLDLVQAGNIGLDRAISRFDPDRGYQFSTYASTRIKQAIGRSITTTSTTIRIPEEVAGPVQSALRQVDGDISRLGPREARIATLMQPASLDEPVAAGGATLSSYLADLAGDVEAEGLRRWDAWRLRRAIDRLPPVDQEMLQLFYGLGDATELTCAEIAARTGVTPTAVQARLRRARVRLVDRLDAVMSGGSLSCSEG